MKDDPRSCDHNLCNCAKKPEKIQDFKGVSTHDLEIPVRRANQLSYEAADIGSWSIVGSYVSVKEMNVNDVYEVNHIRTAEMNAITTVRIMLHLVSFPQFLHDLLHIQHSHSSLSRVYMDPQLTSSPHQWLHSSIG